MKISDDIDGYILAGGASSRMRRPKSELMLGGRSLVERAVTTMSELTGERVTVVGNEVSVESVGKQIKVIVDVASEANAQDNKRAPIFGLFTALTVATTDWIAVLAVDLPFVSGELLFRLASMRREETDAVVPVQPDGRMQPLCGLYRVRTCLAEAEKALSEENWRLQDFVRRLNSHTLSPSQLADITGPSDWLHNVNTPEDFQEALRIEGTLN